MRGALVVVGCLLALGCASEPTSLLVSVDFDDARFHPTAITVTVTPAGSGPYQLAPTGRAIKSGDTFAVLLADSLAGQRVDVAVSAAAEEALAGDGERVVELHKQLPLGILLHAAGAGPDGGVDASTGDLAQAPPDLEAVEGGPRDLAQVDAPPDIAMQQDAAPDLAGADQAVPDMATSDLAVADLTPACVATCTGGSEITCTDAGPSATHCSFGCGAGGKCLEPDTCSTPGDISAGGNFIDSTTGYAYDPPAPSCGGAGGVDAVFKLTTTDWKQVTLATNGTSYPAILSARTSCGDSTTELPVANPCNGAAGPGVACSNPGSSNASLMLCNVPPNVPLYVWLNSTGLGGAYRLSVTPSPAPATLNDCFGAGNLLDGIGRTFSFSTAGHLNNFNVNNTMLSCGDNGTSSPDAVFFLALNAARTVTLTTQAAFSHIVYVRPKCNGTDVSCAGKAGATSNMLRVSLAAGLYYVFVDGIGGASGPVTLTVN